MGKSGNNSPVIRAGALEIDLKARELRRNGQTVAVEEQPFQILSVLVERPGKVISRAEILEKLWSADGLVDPDRSLDIAIDRLRQALGETAEQSIYLEVIPGSGYRFKAKVSASTSRATPPWSRDDDSAVRAAPMAAVGCRNRAGHSRGNAGAVGCGAIQEVEQPSATVEAGSPAIQMS